MGRRRDGSVRAHNHRGERRRGRRLDRSVTIALTDLMAASFTWPLARPLQSPLLAALDLIAPLRRPLAEQLMFGRRGG